MRKSKGEKKKPRKKEERKNVQPMKEAGDRKKKEKK